MLEMKCFIREAAKEVGVEPHVLRYWEEELKVSIERNEQGRRHYSKENIKLFIRIREYKEQGLQLKAIRSKLESEEKGKRQESQIILYHPKTELIEETKEEKVKRVQMLLKEMIVEGVRESQQGFIQEMKEGLVKELDYQFRVQEERLEEREKIKEERSEEYFNRLDEMLRDRMEKKKKRRFF